MIYNNNWTSYAKIADCENIYWKVGLGGCWKGGVPIYDLGQTIIINAELRRIQRLKRERHTAYELTKSKGDSSKEPEWASLNSYIPFSYVISPRCFHPGSNITMGEFSSSQKTMNFEQFINCPKINSGVGADVWGKGRTLPRPTNSTHTPTGFVPAVHRDAIGNKSYCSCSNRKQIQDEVTP